MEIWFERMAANGEPIPDKLSSEDQLLFLSLRMLYHQVKTGLITRAAASAEKKKLVAEIEKRKRQAKFGQKCQDWSVQMFKASEGAMSRYRLDRTLENADRLVMVLDGLERPKQEITN